MDISRILSSQTPSPAHSSSPIQLYKYIKVDGINHPVEIVGHFDGDHFVGNDSAGQAYRLPRDQVYQYENEVPVNSGVPVTSANFIPTTDVLNDRLQSMEINRPEANLRKRRRTSIEHSPRPHPVQTARSHPVLNDPDARVDAWIMSKTGIASLPTLAAHREQLRQYYRDITHGQTIPLPTTMARYLACGVRLQLAIESQGTTLENWINILPSNQDGQLRVELGKWKAMGVRPTQVTHFVAHVMKKEITFAHAVLAYPENEVSLARWSAGKGVAWKTKVAETMAWIEKGTNRANTPLAETWINTTDETEWNKRIDEASVGINVSRLSQPHFRSYICQYRELVLGLESKLAKLPPIWERRIPGLQEIKKEVHRTYLKQYYNALSFFNTKALTDSEKNALGIARFFLKAIENNRNEPDPSKRTIDCCIVERLGGDTASLGQRLAVWLRTCPTPTEEQLKNLEQTILVLAGQDVKRREMRDFIYFITAGKIALNETLIVPALLLHQCVNDKIMHGLGSGNARLVGKGDAATVSRVMCALEKSASGSLVTDWVNVDDEAWAQKRETLVRLVALKTTNASEKMLQKIGVFRLLVRSDHEDIAAIKEQAQRGEAIRSQALLQDPDNANFPDSTDASNSTQLVSVVSTSTDASASTSSPAPLITAIADSTGKRIHAGGTTNPAKLAIRSTDMPEIPHTISVKQDIAALLDKAEAFNMHLQTFFPDGKGDYVPDILHSEGRSHARMAVLHEDSVAQAHFRNIHSYSGRKPVTPAPGASMEKRRSFLQQFLSPRFQPCRIALLEYAKCVARAGGGDSRDISMLATAYAIQQGLNRTNWVVNCRDKKTGHGFTVIGADNDWVVFDPWSQCPAACTLDVFGFKWKETVMAFPPENMGNPGSSSTPELDLEAEARQCQSQDEIEQRMEERGEAHGEEYLTALFTDAKKSVANDVPTLRADVIAAQDPGVCYTSTLHPLGKQYHEIPRTAWTKIASAFNPGEAGKNTLLAGFDMVAVAFQKKSGVQRLNWQSSSEILVRRSSRRMPVPMDIDQEKAPVTVAQTTPVWRPATERPERPIKVIERVLDYDNAPTDVEIARFWDSLDDRSYQNIWHDHRHKWLTKNNAACYLMPDRQQIFVARGLDDQIIGMAWFGFCAFDLPGDIPADETVELCTVVHQDWQGGGIGKQLLNERMRYIKEVRHEENINYVLSQVYETNQQSVERFRRVADQGWQEIEKDESKGLHRFVLHLDDVA